MTRYRLVVGTITAMLLALLAGMAVTQDAGPTCPPQCNAPGGKIKANAKTECWSEFDVTGLSADADKGFKVSCEDGAEGCDVGPEEDSCEFQVRVCVNNNASEKDPRFERCEAGGVGPGGITVKKASKNESLGNLQAAIDAMLPLAAGVNRCTSPVSLTVPLKVKKNGKKKKGKLNVKMKVKGEAKGKDNDKLKLTCTPPEDTVAAACSPNPAGGPDVLLLTVDGRPDLDTGWNLSHNQGIVLGAETRVCLEECDESTNPICKGTGSTGPKSLNGKFFGAPLPLLTQNVATCVLNFHREDVVLENFNLQTGEAFMKVRLRSVVHNTGDVQTPCPTCKVGGTPTIGAKGKCAGKTDRAGGNCTVEGLTEFGPTSTDCLPRSGDNVSGNGLIIDLDLTTESGLLPSDTFTCKPTGQGGSGGPCPCESQERQNRCANECSEANCPSDQTPGIDQKCCTNQSGARVGCFSGDIVTQGTRAIPYADPGAQTGAWPDTTYPKRTNLDAGGALSTPFCIAATDAVIVNQIAGLAGPGAIILPGVLEFSKLE